MEERHDLKLKSLENSILVSIYDSWIEEIAIDGDFANRNWENDDYDNEEANEIERLCHEDYNYYNTEKLMKLLEKRYPEKAIVIIQNGGFYIGGKQQ